MNVADAWELLGIAPTNDIRTVKKAYSNMSKKYHPEEMPNEFRVLYEAYKAALTYAQSRQNEPDLLLPVEQSSKPKDKSLDFTDTEQAPKPQQETFGFFALKDNQQPPTVKTAIPQEETLQFDDLLKQGNLQERERREQSIRLVLQDMEGLCQGWSIRKRRMKWRNYLKTKEFLYVQYMPEFIERFVPFLDKMGKFPDIVWAEIFYAYFVTPENVIEYKPEYSDLFDYLYMKGNDGGYMKHSYKRSKINIMIVFLMYFVYPITLGIVIRYGWWLLVLLLFLLHLFFMWKAQLLKTRKGIFGSTAYTAFLAFFPAFVFNPSVNSTFHNFMNRIAFTRIIYYYLIPALLVFLVIKLFFGRLRVIKQPDK